MLFTAWKNVLRRKGQSIITLSITLVTVFTFVLAFSVFSALQQGLALCGARLGADVIVLPHHTNADAFQTIFTAAPVNIYMPDEIEKQVALAKGAARTTPQFFTQTLDESCCSIGGVTRLVGIDCDSDFVLGPWFEGSETLYLADNQVIIGSNGPAFLGDRVVILDTAFTIAGILQPTGSGMDETIFMDIDTAKKLAQANPYLQTIWSKTNPHQVISAVLVQVSEGFDAMTVAENINSLGLNATAVATSNLVTEMRGQLDIFSRIVFVLWLSLLGVAILALFGRFVALVKERKKEIGILRALGAQKKDVFLLILAEAWILAGAGGLCGSLLGVLCVSPLISSLRAALSLPLGRWTAGTAFVNGFMGLILALALGFFAAVYPALRSASLDPQEAIIRGELD